MWGEYQVNFADLKPCVRNLLRAVLSPRKNHPHLKLELLNITRPVTWGVSKVRTGPRA